MKRHALNLLAVGIVAIAAAGFARADYTKVDDFEARSLGDIQGQGNWETDKTGDGSTNAVVADASGGSTKVLWIKGGSKVHILNEPDFADIPADGIGTVFFRIKVDETKGSADSRIGTDETIGSDPDTGPQYSGDGFKMTASPNTRFVDFSDNGFADTGMWYSFWLVLDNAADTLRYYYQREDGASGQVDAGTGDFRSGVAGPITGFNLYTHGGASFSIDDVYVDNTGENLANPIPEPAALALLLPGAAAILRRRR